MTLSCFVSWSLPAGGGAASLVDVVGTAALITSSTRGGVSLAINVLYLSPMPGQLHLWFTALLECISSTTTA
jgi:acyl-coenzyme A thioesterase PaaI-like protein